MANNENASLCTKNVQTSLPNMLISTSYALNKSNSKRAVVGLEHYSGFYRAVVKLCSSGSPNKYVTLDIHSWEIIVDQMEAMSSYLENSFGFYQEFGNPTKIFLPMHDVHFTSSYGSKAIAIDQRPSVTALLRENEKESQQPTVEDSTSMQPPCKKKKFDNPPSIVMQSATLIGLKDLRECITHRMKYLEENVGFVNRSVDVISDFLKQKINDEPAEKAKTILKDFAAFKQIYTLYKSEISDIVKLQMSDANFDEKLLDVILLELYAYFLPILAKDLYDLMFA